tara:strand:- start:153 stop:674 length:522 start_codon:yes stop_codon:yes gene_type:complete
MRDKNREMDKENQKPSFIIKVNKNGEIEIGKKYTELLDLKPGDQLEIKLGRKQILLLRPGIKMLQFSEKQIEGIQPLSKNKVQSNKLVDNEIAFENQRIEEKKKSFSEEIFDDPISSRFFAGIGWSIMMLRYNWLFVIVLLIVGVSIGELFKLFVVAGLVMTLMLFIIPRPKR